MKESRMIPRFWLEQIEECSCHLLYCSHEPYLVSLMTSEKVMSEIKGTVSWGGMWCLLPRRRGRLIEGNHGLSWRPAAVQGLSPSLAHLAASFSLLETWPPTWLSLMVASGIQCHAGAQAAKVKNCKNVVLFCLSEDRKILGEEAQGVLVGDVSQADDDPLPTLSGHHRRRTAAMPSMT